MSIVDLPAPFGPMMPSASPGVDLERDVAQRPELLRRRALSGCGAARARAPTSAGTRSRRLSWRSPRRNFFQTPSKTTRAHQRFSAKSNSARWNVTQAPARSIDRDGDAVTANGRPRQALVEQHGAERVDDRRHRIERQHRAEPSADAADRVDDRGREHPHRDDDLEQILDVAVEQIRHREQQRRRRGEHRRPRGRPAAAAAIGQPTPTR